MPSESQSSRHHLLLALGISLLLLLWSQRSDLLDRYRIVKDVQNSYWMARFDDPDLIPLDPGLKRLYVDTGVSIAGRELILYPRSLGYGLLFYGLTFFTDEIWISKLLVFLLLPLTVIYVFRLGEKLGGPRTGLITSLVFSLFILSSHQSISIASGLQRAFAVPLLVFFLYALVHDRPWGAAFVIILCGLIYLPLLPVTVLAFAFSLVRRSGRSGFPWQLQWNRVPVFLAAVIPMVLLFGWITYVEYGTIEPRGWRREGVDTELRLVDNPRYQPGGVAPLFLSPPLVGRAGVLEVGAEVVNVIGLSVLGLLAFQVSRLNSFRKVPRAAWLLLGASFTMYAASMVAVFVFSSEALYFPSRYTRFSIFLLIVLFVGLNWESFLDGVIDWFRARGKLWLAALASGGGALMFAALVFPDLPVLPAVGLLFLSMMGALAVLSGSVFELLRRRRTNPSIGRDFAMVFCGVAAVFFAARQLDVLGMVYLDFSQAERQALEYLSELDEGVLIAGDPVLMSAIPLYAHRSVLYREIQPSPAQEAIVETFFRAALSGETDRLIDFCRNYSVDYIVLNSELYTPEFAERGRYFYSPVNERIRAYVEEVGTVEIPDLPIERQFSNWLVMTCAQD